jgi:hypothetical protein
MTPTAKKARNEQQRLHNKTRGRKVAYRESKKRNRELKMIVLNQESIAMENPNYLPDSTSFNVDGCGPHGSILTHDWTIPEVNGAPVYSKSTSDQILNVETPYMHVHKTRKHHVTHGERYSLLADEIHGMTEDAVIDNGSFFNYLLPILSTSLIHC